MRVQLAGVGKHYGAHVILDQVTLTIGPKARIGLVGPNGVGKTTLLRIVAGREQPDVGTITRAPERLTIGYLEQERALEDGASVLELLTRRVGIADAERELEESARALAERASAAERYSAALDRVVALGAGDFEARARATCAELGLGVDLDRAPSGLSGGEAARVALAAILLSRFDLLLLDEPTNDLDFDGLARLERFLGSYRGALVVVSHDRELLDRTVDRIASIEPDTHRVREWAGGWSDYAKARDTERAAALAEFEQARLRRKQLTELLSTRRSEARSKGASLGDKTGGQDRRATHALETKVRQAERLLERNELPAKPFQPWELQLTLDAGPRPSELVLELSGAVAQRGRVSPRPDRPRPCACGAAVRRRAERGGEVDAPRDAARRCTADRWDATRRPAHGHRDDRAGAELVRGRRRSSSTSSPREPGSPRSTRERSSRSSGSVPITSGVAGASLSPGERTRAHLAELQARGVNVLVLDEPTNHLDVEAVEQLERALQSYDGTLVVVSHDRRFLECVAPTREIRIA